MHAHEGIQPVPVACKIEKFGTFSHDKCWNSHHTVKQVETSLMQGSDLASEINAVYVT